MATFIYCNNQTAFYTMILNAKSHEKYLIQDNNELKISSNKNYQIKNINFQKNIIKRHIYVSIISILHYNNKLRVLFFL